MTSRANDRELRWVGRPVPRIDGEAKVRGCATYVHDMAWPGMLFARIKTSPHASARIVRVDTGEAEQVPGVRAVLVGADLPYKVGLYMIDKSILARDVVRYCGEAVAAVAAETELAAEEACERIRIEYEPLPAVLDPVAALAPDAPLVHPGLAEYGRMKGVFFPRPGTNVAHHQKIRKGDLLAGFRAADRTFEHAFSNPPVQHAFLETHTAIVQALPDGRVEIVSSAQSPYTVRQLFSVCFGIPLSRIHVRVPYVGGGFGGKAGIHLEPLVYCLSRKADGRPVKLTISREEAFHTMPSRQGLRSRIRTGVRNDGRITALEVEYLWDAGAYADYGVNVGRAAAYSGAGPYDIPNCHIDSLVVYTNKTFGTAYRGFGHLEVLWGIERNLDLIARELALDPYAIRIGNCLRAGSTTITGEEVTANPGRPDLCLEAAAKAVGWGEPRSGPAPGGTRRRGRGLALLHKAPAMPVFTSCSAILKFNEDASVDLLVSGVDYGQGTYTALAQIAAEELGLPVDRIHVVWECDTDFTPYDWQTVASRFAFMGGNAVIDAARDCLAQLRAVAAQVLHAPESELVCADGKVSVVHNPGSSLDYRRLVMGYTYPNGNSIGGPVIGRGRYIAQGLTHLDPETGQGRPALDWTYGAHAVELEVDTATGDIEILHLASAFDVGKTLNRQQVVTQIIGGVVQGIGSAVSEEFLFDAQGRFRNAGFVDYKIPTAKDIPRRMSQHIVETPQLDGPYGARGVAEHPMISIPGAIGNALADALGIDFFELPLNPERVYLAIKKAGRKKTTDEHR
ncbi:MAG: xanthine dehydrogenase family protein [Acidobacteria bacterium]|nr:xanthine dehydrogenase family protein [Acidobacteriota bacterium]